VLVAQVLFNSGENGISVTFARVLLFGLGFAFVAAVVGVILLCFVEFPLRRILQYLILPYISHDNLLREHYEK
jgi:hypothetical protein